MQKTAKQIDEKEALAKAQSYSLKLLNIRPRSEKELRDKLISKFDSETVEKTIALLKRINLINDERFAKLWTDSRKNIKQKSSYVVSQELRQKGVDQEHIDKALSGTESDLDSAKRLLSKKMYRFDGLPELKRKQKIQQFLANKGFSWDVIKEAISSLENIKY